MLTIVLFVALTALLFSILTWRLPVEAENERRRRYVKHDVGMTKELYGQVRHAALAMTASFDSFIESIKLAHDQTEFFRKAVNAEMRKP